MNYYDSYEVAANGDVTVRVFTDERYVYDAVIPFAEFQRIADESRNAERGMTDQPKVRGMI